MIEAFGSRVEIANPGEAICARHHEPGVPGAEVTWSQQAANFRAFRQMP